MANLKEEQQDEMEALESIYLDSFRVLSDEPKCFCVDVETNDDDDPQQVDPLSASLQFTYPPNYPDEPPLFELIESEGFPDDDHINKINVLVDEQIEENMGMVMVFTIISAVQEFLNETKDEMIRNIKEVQERKEREIREAEERKCHGIPVTVATFLAWKAKFDEEISKIEEKLQAEKKEKKLTGKEIFLQMKHVSDDSELLEGETEAVEVDESLFDDLDDLELDDELDAS